MSSIHLDCSQEWDHAVLLFLCPIHGSANSRFSSCPFLYPIHLSIATQNVSFSWLLGVTLQWTGGSSYLSNFCSSHFLWTHTTMWVVELHHAVVWDLIFFGNNYHNGCVNLHFYEWYIRAPFYSHLQSSFNLLTFDNSDPNTCEIIAHCGFDVYFGMIFDD